MALATRNIFFFILALFVSTDFLKKPNLNFKPQLHIENEKSVKMSKC